MVENRKPQYILLPRAFSLLGQLMFFTQIKYLIILKLLQFIKLQFSMKKK